MTVSQKDQDYCINLVRQIIKKSLSLPIAEELPPTDSPLLREDCGAFVTLKMDNNLRGCIGRTQTIDPLEKTLKEMARAAAFEDPRFPPLTPQEFSRIKVEISLLSPMEEVESWDLIQVGIHGLMIRKGHHSGLLLPQVPVEQGWDTETFKEKTCWKAHLPPQGWKDPEARLYQFTAYVFGEE